MLRSPQRRPKSSVNAISPRASNVLPGHEPLPLLSPATAAAAERQPWPLRGPFHQFHQFHGFDTFATFLLFLTHPLSCLLPLPPSGHRSPSRDSPKEVRNLSVESLGRFPRPSAPKARWPPHAERGDGHSLRRLVGAPRGRPAAAGRRRHFCSMCCARVRHDGQHEEVVIQGQFTAAVGNTVHLL